MPVLVKTMFCTVDVCPVGNEPPITGDLTSVLGSVACSMNGTRYAPVNAKFPLELLVVERCAASSIVKSGSEYTTGAFGRIVTPSPASAWPVIVPTFELAGGSGARVLDPSAGTTQLTI